MSLSRSTKLITSLLLGASMAAVSFQGLADQPKSSGFIENLPADMKPDPAGPGAMRWESPKVNLSNYSKILLQPLTVYVAPDSEEKGLSEPALKSLSDAFREQMIGHMEPAYPVVDKTGKGVLVLRPALSNVYLEKNSFGLLDITPIGIVANVVRDTHTKKFYLKKATFEVEALDGETGERVVVLIDTAPEKAGLYEQDYLDWTRIENAFAFYAKRMVKRLDSSRVK